MNIENKTIDLLNRLQLHKVPGGSPNLFYHSASGVLIDVDEPACELFERRESGDSLEEIVQEMAEKWGYERMEKTIEGAQKTAGYLLAFGDDAFALDKERAISELLDHHPCNIMLFTTNKCNFACTYCYERSDWKKLSDSALSEETMIQAVDDLFERSGERRNIKITFFGGEPLLNFPLIKKAVDYALHRAASTKKIINFSISTNGSLLSDEIIEYLVKYRFGVLVSIDGPKEVHDAHRVLPSGECTYDLVAPRVLKLLERQREERITPLLIRSTMTGDDQDFYELRHQLTRAFPGARIMVGENTGTIVEKPEDSVSCKSEEDVREKLEDMCEGLMEYDEKALMERYSQTFPLLSEVHQKLTGSGPTYMPFSICGICRNELGVSADGSYYPCHRFVGLEKFCTGHASESIDRDKTRKCYEHYFDVLERACSDCWARRLCGGPCAANIAIPEDGTYGDPDQDRCRNLRIMYGYILRAYWLLRSRRPELYAKYINDTHEKYDALDDARQFVAF